jgi:para-aminobenzoate synthetase
LRRFAIDASTFGGSEFLAGVPVRWDDDGWIGAAREMIQTLLIDNYDSFTFNLFQLIAQVNGHEPIVIKNDQLAWDDLKTYRFDNVVISPGPGRPQNRRDFGVSRDAILFATAPILGVCLGHQGIGDAFGAAVALAPEPMHGRVAQVHHHNDPLFAGVPSPFSAVRYHSLCVVSPILPPLTAIAWTADGVIMGIRHVDRPIWGIQFHPESICSDYGHRILANFRDLSHSFIQASKGRPQRSSPPAKSAVALAGEPAADRHPRFQLRSRRLDICPDAQAVFAATYRRSPSAFWLDSSLVVPGLSRFSFMGDSSGPNSFRVLYDTQSRRVTVADSSTSRRIEQSVFDYLREFIEDVRVAPADLPFDFTCGFVGYFGYELKRECGAGFAYKSDTPDAYFLFADRLIAIDHLAAVTYLVCLAPVGDSADQSECWFDSIEAHLRRIAAAGRCASAPARPEIALARRYQHSPPEYLTLIERCLRELRDGESYEICLTNKILPDARIDPMATYNVMRAINPAPYAAFLKFPGLSILSASPERFVKICPEGNVESRPIKGTAPRGRTPADDDRIRRDLQSSEKERAENMMIVDLIRNDLGRVCKIGSVEVPRLMEVESYATVHQLVSTVRGCLRSGVTAIDCLRAAFPGGSMTGAPKLRTMEIIDRLENQARGIYSGALGFLSISGAADFSIVIRTIVVADGAISIGVGGAIVVGSEPARELEEAMLKAEAPLRAIALSCD